MRFSIHFQRHKAGPKKPANRNLHDPFYWEFACDVSEWSRKECVVTEADWQTQKTIHDLYEIYNAPHIQEWERRKRAACYIVEKEFALLGQKEINEYLKPEQSVFSMEPPESISWNELL